MRYFEMKSVSKSLDDVDVKNRIVTGYFSRFGNEDSDGDVIVAGAFKKTIRERGQDGRNLIVHLADHWMNTDHLLGKPKLYERKDGGYFETPFSDTQKCIDTLKLYRDGVLDQHSFGFRTTKWEEKKSYREIQEVMIYEISTVVLGANDNTPFTGFKSMTKPELHERYKTLSKAFYGGDYSDEVFPIIEAQIKQLEYEIAQLAISDTTEPVRSTTQPELKEDDLLDLAIGKQLLTLKLAQYV